MDDWFTVEKVDEETFVISEYKHWEETHCYLLIGKEKVLLIDTGLGVENIKKVVDKITSLPIEVVLTHVHWDHIGGSKYFNNIAVHKNEKEWLTSKFPIPLEVVKKNLMFKECKFPKTFNIDEFKITKCCPKRILEDGDFIDLGNRKVEVIHTPGHSPGHICLYERDKQYLYSGDLIYQGTLYAFYPTTDPYKFMMSVKKVRNLPIKKVLPAHHKLKIDVSLIGEIDKAFTKIMEAGKLVQGNGMFNFKNFNIQI